MTQTSPRKSVTDRALARIEFGQQIAHELRTASSGQGNPTAQILNALAGRFDLCNTRDNTALIYDYTTTIQRISLEYLTNISRNCDGYHTRLWRCGSKLCPDCLARQCRITRRRLTNAVDRVKLNAGERWSFVTFTIPNPGLSLTETRSIVNRAWTLFRKRSLCVSLVRGGSKSEEFTVTEKGIHYHLHCLWVHRWLLYNEVRRVWTDCVQQAFHDHERPFKCNNSDGLLSVMIKKVRPDAFLIRELCKYVTKSDSWSKIPKSDLVEVAMIRRWHRMFELFGCLSDRTTQATIETPAILDTEDLSDGRSGPSHYSWRDLVQEFPVHRYLQQLHLEVRRRQDLRLRRLIAKEHTKRIYNLACIDGI